MSTPLYSDGPVVRASLETRTDSQVGYCADPHTLHTHHVRIALRAREEVRGSLTLIILHAASAPPPC